MSDDPYAFTISSDDENDVTKDLSFTSFQKRSNMRVENAYQDKSYRSTTLNNTSSTLKERQDRLDKDTHRKRIKLVKKI